MFATKTMAYFTKVASNDDDCVQGNEKLERNLGLMDLVCVGLGSTIGSGVFCLTGYIAAEYSGPGVIVSWLLAGLACCFSALSFAELTTRIPSSGSSYAFLYVTLGELPAFLAMWCLTLECGISGAAVARSWGTKLDLYLINNGLDDFAATDGSDDSIGFNFYSALLQLITIMIFRYGMLSLYLSNLYSNSKL